MHLSFPPEKVTMTFMAFVLILHSRLAVDEEVNTWSAFIPTAVVKIRNLNRSTCCIDEIYITTRTNSLNLCLRPVYTLYLHHEGFIAPTFITSSGTTARIFHNLQFNYIA